VSAGNRNGRGDAYQGEMWLSQGISDRDAERLLRGGIPAGGGPELEPVASFVRALGAAVPEAPDPAQARSLVPRVAAAAASAPERSGPARARHPRRRNRLALGLRLATAAALVPVLAAGLAVAGVELPGPAQDAFERVGISLPNQAEENANSDEAPPAGRPASRGSEDGQRTDGSGGAADPRAKRKAYGPERAQREDPPGEAFRRGPNPDPGTAPGKPDQLPAPAAPPASEGGDAGGSPLGKAPDRGPQTADQMGAGRGRH
jgi:hypothetical protein